MTNYWTDVTYSQKSTVILSIMSTKNPCRAWIVWPLCLKPPMGEEGGRRRCPSSSAGDEGRRRRHPSNSTSKPTQPSKSSGSASAAPQSAPKDSAQKTAAAAQGRKNESATGGKKSVNKWSPPPPLLVCTGVREKTWSNSWSAFSSFHLQSQSDERLVTGWLNLIFHLCISFKCRRDRQSFHLCAWRLITFTKTTTTTTKNAFPAFPF